MTQPAKRPEPALRTRAADAFDHIRDRMREIAREEGRPGFDPLAGNREASAP